MKVSGYPVDTPSRLKINQSACRLLALETKHLSYEFLTVSRGEPEIVYEIINPWVSFRSRTPHVINLKHILLTINYMSLCACWLRLIELLFENIFFMLNFWLYTLCIICIDVDVARSNCCEYVNQKVCNNTNYISIFKSSSVSTYW